MNERIGNKHVIIRSKRKKDIDMVQNVNQIYASNYPERNTLALHKMGKLPSYNANQPIKSRKRKKIAIISDSTTKPIEFNDSVVNGDAIKRAYGGATAARLKYYAKSIIEDDKPDRIIICAGTNNFTKTIQSAEEITEEIMDIVNTCRSNCIERIFCLFYYVPP